MLIIKDNSPEANNKQGEHSANVIPTWCCFLVLIWIRKDGLCFSVKVILKMLSKLFDWIKYEMMQLCRWDWGKARKQLETCVNVSGVLQGYSAPRVWEQSFNRLRLTGFGGGAPDAAAIFLLFFSKIRIFRYFWSTFLLKTSFLNGWIKCVDTPPRTAPRGACPTCPFSRYVTESVG